MIISASRRTDIPAFYSTWFMNRVRAEFCTVPNPMNMKQVSLISLEQQDVDCFVFWTRNASPLLKYMEELDSMGFKYYFLYTINNYPDIFDPHNPPLEKSIKTIESINKIIGPGKVTWRYDPIVLSNITDFKFHSNNYKKIASSLNGLTEKSIISFFDIYEKNKNKINFLKSKGVKIKKENDFSFRDLKDFLTELSDIANQNSIQIQHCSSPTMFKCGIMQGSCIDHKYIKEVFNLSTTTARDRAQRKGCLCTVSRDIGMYDSCTYGCIYCYANRNINLSKKNQKDHDPESQSLLGHHKYNKSLSPLRKMEET